MDFKAELKKPWVKYSLIVVGIIGAFVVYRSVSGGSSSASSTSGGESDADYAADAQQAINSANLQASASGQAAQLAAAAASQTSGQQYGLATLQESDSEQIALAGVQLKGLQSQLDAQTAQLVNNNQTTVAGETLIADTQNHISDNQTAISLAQTSNAKTVAISGQQKGLIGNVVGSIAGIFKGLF